MTIDRIKSNGLELELAPRRMSGPLVGGWQPRQVVAAVLQAPALVLLAVLVVPSVATVWFALRARILVVVCCAAVVCVAWTVRRLPRVDWLPGRAELSLWTMWLAGVVCTAMVQAIRQRWVAAGGWAAVALTGAVLLAHWLWLCDNDSRARIMMLAGACGLWLAGALGLAVGIATDHDWRAVGTGVAVVGWAAAVVPGVVLMVRGAPPGHGGDRARAVVVGWAWLATVVGVAVVVVMRADRLAAIGCVAAAVPGALFLVRGIGHNGVRSRAAVRWVWSVIVVGVAIIVLARNGWRGVGDGMAVVGWVAAAVPGVVLIVRGTALWRKAIRSRSAALPMACLAVMAGGLVVVILGNDRWTLIGGAVSVTSGAVFLGYDLLSRREGSRAVRAWLAIVVGVAVVVVSRADWPAAVGCVAAVVSGAVFVVHEIALGRGGIRSRATVGWVWLAAVAGVAVAVMVRGDWPAVIGWLLAAVPGAVIWAWREAFVPERFRARTVVVGWVWAAIGVGIAVVE
uniref:hypothetical protein n=1 Tax=Nocardia alni TaxID=2815723 RepID=UPI001C21EA33